MNVVVLPSARLRDAGSNLAGMIERARRSPAFSAVEFDAPMWTVALTKTKRASSARATVSRLYFTEAKAGGRGPEGRVPLREPFASFVKAVIRLREGASPRHLDDHAAVIRAARFLHDQIGDIAFDPSGLLPDHFDRAARASLVSDSASTAYAIGKKLVELADWVSRYNVARVRIDFRNPNPRADDSNVRIGEEADARRERKLPSAAALDALARLSNLVTEDGDVLRMRTIELLVCGGWRINELLSIPADCEVEERAFENGKALLDSEGSEIVRYGIRYLGEKGAPPAIKWVPTALVDVARRAVADIRRITQPTRDAAVWMEAHPGRVPLEGLDGPDPDRTIPVRSLGRLLGLAQDNGLQWCKVWSVPTSALSERKIVARVGDVCAAIRGAMPKVPRDSPLRLSQHLFLIPENFLHGNRAAIPGSVRFLTDGMVTAFIGGHAATKSVFERFGMLDAQGDPFRMNTHQFRHWLNTLAQEGGMSQLEIARWSGRKDVFQNAAYDHVSGAQLAKRVRSLVESGGIVGPIAEARDRLPPVDRKRFLEAQVATAHITDIGMCLHDWSLLPCAKHGACADCGEHVVVKGDVPQRDEAKRLLGETQFLLSKARAEHEDGTYGASRWVAAHERMAHGLETVLSIHEDPTIADGTLVQARTTAA